MTDVEQITSNEDRAQTFLQKMWDRRDDTVALHDAVYMFVALTITGCLVAWMVYGLMKHLDLTSWGSTAVWVMAIAAGSKSIGDGSVQLPSFLGGVKK